MSALATYELRRAHAGTEPAIATAPPDTSAAEARADRISDRVHELLASEAWVIDTLAERDGPIPMNDSWCAVDVLVRAAFRADPLAERAALRVIEAWLTRRAVAQAENEENGDA